MMNVYSNFFIFKTLRSLNSKFYFFTFILTVLIFTFTVQANPPEDSNAEKRVNSKLIKDHFANVKNAETNLPVDVNEVSKANSIWVLYQKNCPACHLMMKESSCFTKTNSSVYFLGIGASPESLVKEARSQEYKGPVYYASAELQNDLDLQVTPTIFVFKKEILFSRVNNYLNCNSVKKILKSF